MDEGPTVGLEVPDWQVGRESTRDGTEAPGSLRAGTGSVTGCPCAGKSMRYYPHNPIRPDDRAADEAEKRNPLRELFRLPDPPIWALLR